MKNSFFIPNVGFEERIKRIIDLGKKQGGYIREDQFSDELKGVDIYDTQLEILHERLKENNIIIRTLRLTDKERNQLKRKKYFIDEAEVDMTSVKEIDKCLSFDEFVLLFAARYDEKISDKEKRLVKQSLANRIKHVENCPDCLSWCQYGVGLYKDICNNRPPFLNGKFFSTFDRDYQRWLKRQNERKALCSQEGHIFGEWTYYECTTPNTKCKEWSRVCKRCKCVEKSNSKPDEVSKKKLVRKG